MTKDKIKHIILPVQTRHFVNYEVNNSKLYQGCSKSKWDPDGCRFRRTKSFRAKVNKAFGASYKYDHGCKRLQDARRIANKLAKIPEIKTVTIATQDIPLENLT